MQENIHSILSEFKGHVDTMMMIQEGEKADFNQLVDELELYLLRYVEKRGGFKE